MSSPTGVGIVYIYTSHAEETRCGGLWKEDIWSSGDRDWCGEMSSRGIGINGCLTLGSMKACMRVLAVSMGWVTKDANIPVLIPETTRDVPGGPSLAREVLSMYVWSTGHSPK